MQRPILVIVGGTEDQPLECLYCGHEGEQSLEVFQAAADDGRNELVRLFHYPDYSRVATPMKDGVAPAEDIEEEKAVFYTQEVMDAAEANIKDLFAQLEAERKKTDECGRAHKAALTRISKLEGMLEKAVAKPKLATAPAEKPAVDPAAKPE